MPDMLVKLYELPDAPSEAAFAAQSGVTVRRALAPEKHVVAQWIGERFGKGWVSEAEVAFARTPVSCFIAVEGGRVVGFSCYDATMKGFFGPTGVDEKARGRGVGKILFLYAMHAMRAEGYGYAIIGGAGPTQFYAKAAGAVEIPGSQPGIYKGMLPL
ncbi:GNAT family N-acetyltransferase [Paenibacillus sp.]|uniref:GNAT family N-acetyltransferase n=1 Tax=Paenibacillus sp. TaxID=58172 RepID=UPI002D238C54|nr:GNAT family N-acetyltransferase [Paenibacillus sp.]HZG57021.1 GNAT family N-acetyltransferase [Paenibacillus sp.]